MTDVASLREAAYLVPPSGGGSARDWAEQGVVAHVKRVRQGKPCAHGASHSSAQQQTAPPADDARAWPTLNRSGASKIEIEIENEANYLN